MDWLEQLRMGDKVIWLEKPLIGSGRALALAPHPDDPEAVAVTLRLLALGGWDLNWVILTEAWSGVQDDFVGPSQGKKSQVREAEQRASAQLFGLPESRLHFLRLAEDIHGNMDHTGTNQQRLFEFLFQMRPDLVLLPCREDTNPTHQLTYEWFAQWANSAKHRVVALGNEDPKTVHFQSVFEVHFGMEAANWKAALLECHRSQSARNLATRQMTFAERILRVNRAVPGLAQGMHAERFQVEVWQPGT